MLRDKKIEETLANNILQCYNTYDNMMEIAKRVDLAVHSYFMQ